MAVFYNDIDKYCCRWLEHLILGGELPDGLVFADRILMANYIDLSQFSACHFFAGIGGWPLALRLANWPDDEIVWTGSCPCQPFSIASQSKKLTADERHLWPDFFQLIEKYHPATIFGEQVSGPNGREWLAEVRNDLESIGYAVGASDLSAKIIGAEHERQRLFWVADSSSARLERFESRRQRLRQSATKASAERSYDCIRTRIRLPTNSILIPTFDGISRPVDIIRAFGNSIVPDAAAEFILAFMESI